MARRPDLESNRPRRARQVGLRLEPDLDDWCRQLAKIQNCSKSEFIRRVLNAEKIRRGRIPVAESTR